MIYQVYQGFIIMAQDERDLDSKKFKISNGDIRGFIFVGIDKEKLEQFCNKHKIGIKLFDISNTAELYNSVDDAIVEDDIMNLCETLKDITDGK